MTPEQQERFHRDTLHWIRNRAWTIKRELNEKADRIVLEMGLGTLRSIGYRRLGLAPVCEYFECTKCGTCYPVMDGEIRCNGRSITKCLCQEPAPNAW